MLSLNRRGREMPFAGGNFIFSPLTRVDSTIAAVVTDTIHRDAVDHGCVVHIVNIDDIHIRNRTIVEEAVAVPTPAFIALTGVAKAVSDAAVETNMRTP